MSVTAGIASMDLERCWQDMNYSCDRLSFRPSSPQLIVKHDHCGPVREGAVCDLSAHFRIYSHLKVVNTLVYTLIRLAPTHSRSADRVDAHPVLMGQRWMPPSSLIDSPAESTLTFA